MRCTYLSREPTQSRFRVARFEDERHPQCVKRLLQVSQTVMQPPLACATQLPLITQLDVSYIDRNDTAPRSGSGEPWQVREAQVVPEPIEGDIRHRFAPLTGPLIRQCTWREAKRHRLQILRGKAHLPGLDLDLK